MSTDHILLESGTNELEILEFTIGENHFGINVIKVREIINPVHVTRLPQSHRSVEGMVNIRGEVLPVIDLAKTLGAKPSPNPTQDKFIITEFNKQKFIFHVHSVTQIYRISWEEIEKPSTMYEGAENTITGVVNLNGTLIMLLDFEKLMVDINPKLGVNTEGISKLGTRERSNKTILIAEDSMMLQKLIEDSLVQAGYVNLEIFENGKDAYDFLQSQISTGLKIEEKIQLILTDIEMPKMDGHHLTKKVRENQHLKHLPVIIFSSLITDDLRHKGEKVGATAQVSKPEIVELVGLIDEFIL